MISTGVQKAGSVPPFTGSWQFYDCEGRPGVTHLWGPFHLAQSGRTWGFSVRSLLNWIQIFPGGREAKCIILGRGNWAESGCVNAHIAAREDAVPTGCVDPSSVQKERGGWSSRIRPCSITCVTLCHELYPMNIIKTKFEQGTLLIFHFDNASFPRGKKKSLFDSAQGTLLSALWWPKW